MIVTKKALPRRTFLRGAGAVLSLPLLDSMIPALTAGAAKPVKRLGFVYVPMGSHIKSWTPPGAGRLTDLSPTLQALAPVADRVTVLTNMELKNSYPGTHATSNSGFLSAATAKWTESSDYYLGTTVDQIAAKHLRSQVRLPSLELAMDLLTAVGQCDNGYACVYQNNLSWSSPTTPLPAEAHPRVAFERLFGDGGSSAERRAQLRENSSLLDWVKDDIGRLQRTLGPSDRSKVSHYLDTVREVERRIQKAEAEAADSKLPDLDRPVGVPALYADHARLMFDLQVLAMQGDVTRVITFQLAREASTRTYPEIGVPEAHHPLMHNGGNPEKQAQVAKINAFHVSLFAYYLQKLKETPDGDGSLLDHSMILYGSGMGNPDVHDHVNLPIVVAGGGAGQMKGGQHIRYADPAPLANLHLTLLEKVGVKMDTFADAGAKSTSCCRYDARGVSGSFLRSVVGCGRRRHNSTASRGVAGRFRRREATPEEWRGREGSKPLRRDRPFPGLHERKRRDSRAAARCRRGREYDVARWRDGFDDGFAHWQCGIGEIPAEAWRGRRSERESSWTNGVDVGGCGRSLRRDRNLDRGGGRCSRPVEFRVYTVPIRRSRRKDRRGEDAVESES